MRDLVWFGLPSFFLFSRTLLFAFTFSERCIMPVMFDMPMMWLTCAWRSAQSLTFLLFTFLCIYLAFAFYNPHAVYQKHSMERSDPVLLLQTNWTMELPYEPLRSLNREL